MSDTPNPPAAPATRKLELVRPGLFMLDQVAGTTVPHICVQDGKPTCRHELVLIWKDGRRERRPFQQGLDVGDDVQVHFDPLPVSKARRDQPPSWSEEGIKTWCENKEPSLQEVFADICEMIRRVIWFPEDVRDQNAGMLAAAVLATWFPIFETVPYFHIRGLKACGKTSLMNLLAALVYAPLASSNATGASVFRSLDGSGGTLLLDEAESLASRSDRSADLSTILLSGHRRGSPVLRCVGDHHEPEEFDVFGFKFIAGINDVGPTLSSRCIPIYMCRRPPSEPEHRVKQEELTTLRDRIRGATLAMAYKVRAEIDRDVDLPGLSNRDADLARPIIAALRLVQGEPGEGADLVKSTCEFIRDLLEHDRDDSTAEDGQAAMSELVESLEKNKGSETQVKHVHTRLLAIDRPRWELRTDRWIGSLLRSYGIKTRKTKGKRVFADWTAEKVRKVMRDHGLLDEPS
jgi:hypothetical protein